VNILVGVISPFEAWILPRQFVDYLREAFPQHTFVEAWDREAIRRHLPEVDAAFTPFVDRDLVPSLTRLRWVQSPAVGVGSLLFPEMLASPIVLTTARGIRARAIAEHVIGVTIALARQFPAVLRFQVAHHWGQDSLEGKSTAIITLQNRRMGIVGLGSIGQETARMAEALGMHVSGIQRNLKEPTLKEPMLPPGVAAVMAPAELPSLLASSDVVVLAAPLTPQTRGLIGAREVAAMKRGAFLVNIGRGQLVVDEAIVDGLKSGQLGGAALDVFTHEPLDAASPYWDLPNVIVTPHTSGAMQDYWTPLVRLFSQNLRRFERGEPLLNVVDKVSGY
jgi:phosphoglycerate dehydrogenase-like enzyme